MDDGFGIIGILIFAVFIGFIFGSLSGQNKIEEQAIQRGYALYCPTSGDFAWRNECDEM